MIVSDAAARREVRVGALVVTTIGWLLVLAGVVTDEGAVVVAGAGVVGTSSVLVLKLLLESRSVLQASAMSAQSLAAEARGRASDRRHDRERLDELQRAVESVAREAADTALRHERLYEDLDAAATDLAGRVSRAEQDLQTRRASQLGLERETRAAVDAIGLTRSIVDKLAARIPTALALRLSAVARSNVDQPLLSISVPSYNRPGPLRECLDSIEREIRGGFDGVVEVCIMDDASSDPETLEIAIDFAERCPFAAVHRQPTNVGIERNVVAACQVCHGEFVLLFGNDDRMVEGALAAILDDLRSTDVGVVLYDKARITVDGQRREPVPGSTPVDISRGASHRFGTLIEAARPQGFMSTFGFISTVVFRRSPFLAVDPTPYLDLTMYAHVFVQIEAFTESPVLYHNIPVAYHRTAPQDHKRVEAMGRREVVFMSGGPARSVRYFGTTLAAAWQRVLDRTGVDPAFLRDQPENLMTTMLLVPWIVANRTIDVGADAALDPGIVADAERFLASVELEPTR